MMGIEGCVYREDFLLYALQSNFITLAKYDIHAVRILSGLFPVYRLLYAHLAGYPVVGPPSNF